MNFEHLNKYVVNNAPKLTRASLKKIKKMLIYLRSVTILNRQKLKLGKVVFIINTFDSRFPFKPLITVKFSHQDGSTAPENQIERLYDEFSWKWTKIHLTSLLIVLSFAIWSIWRNLHLWILVNLPFLHQSNILFENLVHLALTQVFTRLITDESSLDLTYSFYIDLICELCLFYNIII